MRVCNRVSSTPTPACRPSPPYYGVYDLTTTDKMHPLMMPLLEHVVVQRRLEDNPQLYRDASPMHRIHRDAPRRSSSCTARAMP